MSGPFCGRAGCGHALHLHKHGLERTHCGLCGCGSFVRPEPADARREAAVKRLHAAAEGMTREELLRVALHLAQKVPPAEAREAVEAAVNEVLSQR